MIDYRQEWRYSPLRCSISVVSICDSRLTLRDLFPLSDVEALMPDVGVSKGNLAHVRV